MPYQICRFNMITMNRQCETGCNNINQILELQIKEMVWFDDRFLLYFANKKSDRLSSLVTWLEFHYMHSTTIIFNTSKRPNERVLMQNNSANLKNKNLSDTYCAAPIHTIHSIRHSLKPYLKSMKFYYWPNCYWCGCYRYDCCVLFFSFFDSIRNQTHTYS